MWAGLEDLDRALATEGKRTQERRVSFQTLLYGNRLRAVLPHRPTVCGTGLGADAAVTYR